MKSILEFNNIDSIISLYKERNLEWIVCNKIYNKKLFDIVQFENVAILEDVLITPKLFFYAERIIHVDASFYYYFQRPGSIVNSELNFSKFQGSMFVFNQLIRFFEEKENFDLVHYAEKMLCSSLINWKIRLERKSLCDNLFNKEIRYLFRVNRFRFLKNRLISRKFKALVLISTISIEIITIYGKAAK